MTSPPTSTNENDSNKELKEEQEQEGRSSSSSSSSSSSTTPLIDIETFLNFAVECCSCLQLLHANGIIHGELRSSAFHWYKNSSMTVKIWNFGAGLKSYEDILLTSSGWRRAVLAAAAHDDILDDPALLDPLATSFTTRSAPRGFQNALAYVSPVSRYIYIYIITLSNTHISYYKI